MVSNQIGIALGSLLLLLLAWFTLSVTGKEGKKEHVFLRLILLIFFINSLVLVGKAGVDNCHILKYNQTVDGNTTTYNYKNVCLDNPKSTDTAFYKLMVGLQRLFWIYVIVYLSYVYLVYKGLIKPKKIKQRVLGRR